MIKRLKPLEIFLIEVTIYLLIWVLNDYVGSLLSIIFCFIFASILIISLLVEWIEKSKVPRWYYLFMLMSIIAPIIASLIMVMVGGIPSWLLE